MLRIQTLLMRAVAVAVAAGIFLSSAAEAAPERIKDLASIAGVRDNQLVGYGLVVGLDGSGDQTTQTPFTKQSIVNMLSNMGVTVPQGTNMQLKNVAAVMVTANLPAFARPGQAIDVTVSSIGNAKSLRGGTLIMTPLKGADGQVYAVAQGNLVVGGAGAQAGGAAQTINHLAAGRIPAGATVERAVASSVGQGDYVMLELNQTDFGTARRVVDAINAVSPGSARALDGRSVEVRAPTDVSYRVAFLAQIENLRVTPEQQVAKVIVELAHRLGGDEPARDAAERGGVARQSHRHRQQRDAGQPAQSAVAGPDGDCAEPGPGRYPAGQWQHPQRARRRQPRRCGQGAQCTGCQAHGSGQHPAGDEGCGCLARRTRDHLRLGP
ncbi:Flagellar P-ring protein [Thauera mechernichensis]